jgi:uncharacterized repeat protein (TIGR01451 family)
MSAVVEGALESTPSSTFRIELFSSPACDPSGYGEGREFLSSLEVQTGAGGTVTFSTSVVAPIGDFLTATASRIVAGPNDTSEFSMCRQVTPLQADLEASQSDSADPVEVGDTFTYTAEVTNLGPDEATTVTIADTLPDRVSFAEADGCTHDGAVTGGTVVCAVGNLAVGATVSAEIVVTAVAEGTATNNVIASAAESDPDPSNSSASEDTTIAPDEEPPPDQTHERSIKLKRPRSVAGGKMKVAGTVVAATYADCRSSVPVKIQRRTKKGWRKAAKTMTNGEGKYKVRFRKRPGSYRAVASKILLTDGDGVQHTCTTARSKARRVRR